MEVNENEDVLSNDKSLQCLRIEINSHVTVFLYYKKFPKADSKKFPQDRTAILFYFDNDNVNEKFIKSYISVVGQIEAIEIGSYINKKGSKRKRRIINFALVKFVDDDSLNNLLNRLDTQLKINEFLETKKNRKVALNYDTVIDEENEEEAEVDSDGFIKATWRPNKKRFTGGGASFKVSKKDNTIDVDIENVTVKKKIKPEGDFYWNFQLMDKKKQMYNELKNLFEEDKKAVENKSIEKQFKKSLYDH